MLVGEQPGDQEDRQGRPFVGPAGRILAKALAAVGMDRSQIYITNAVKHFKNVPRGKRRIHQKPTVGEIDSCKWWLDLELKLVRPRIVIALGASAGRALLGHPVKIEPHRGRPIGFGAERWLVVTIHPSLLLRIQDAGARAEALERFIEDLRIAKKLTSKRGPRAPPDGANGVSRRVPALCSLAALLDLCGGSQEHMQSISAIMNSQSRGPSCEDELSLPRQALARQFAIDLQSQPCSCTGCSTGPSHETRTAARARIAEVRRRGATVRPAN